MSLSDAVTSPTTSMSSHRYRQIDSDAEDDTVTTTTAFLKSSKGIQNAIDRRLQELPTLNEQGMFKSQRGGHEQVTVKHKIPWPQNHILAGTSNSRVTCDSFSTFQWAMGLRFLFNNER